MKKKILLSFLLAAWTIASVAHAETGALKLPTPAQQAGFYANTFHSTFQGDVDLDDKRQEGLHWYLGKGFGWPATKTTSLSIGDDGSLTILNDSESIHQRGVLNYSVASAAPSPRKTSPAWTGTAFGGGGYFEAEVKFDPHSVSAAGTQGFPSWWMEPIEHMRPPYTQWKDQSDGYAHFVEVDILEYNTFKKYPPNTYAASLHEWYGVYGKTCQPQFCQVTNYNGKTAYTNNIVKLPENIDLNAYHKYGVLWVQATDSAKGSLQYFFDGEPASAKIEWTKYQDEPPPPGQTPWTFGIMDRLHYVLILGTGLNQPMAVKSVTVWQKSAVQNLTP